MRDVTGIPEPQTTKGGGASARHPVTWEPIGPTHRCVGEVCASPRDFRASEERRLEKGSGAARTRSRPEKKPTATTAWNGCPPPEVKPAFRSQTEKDPPLSLFFFFFLTLSPSAHLPCQLLTHSGEPSSAESGFLLPSCDLKVYDVMISFGVQDCVFSGA